MHKRPQHRQYQWHGVRRQQRQQTRTAVPRAHQVQQYCTHTQENGGDFYKRNARMLSLSCRSIAFQVIPRDSMILDGVPCISISHRWTAPAQHLGGNIHLALAAPVCVVPSSFHVPTREKRREKASIGERATIVARSYRRVIMPEAGLR